MPKFKRSSQSGFTLIELAIVIAVSILLTAAMLWPKVVQLRQQKATMQGTQLATLNNIVATFQTKNYGNLVAGTSVAGVANAYAPTIAELQNWGLPANFSATNMYGGGYAVAISKIPAGCTAPNCDLKALVYLTKPILNPLTGNVDGGALGDAVQAMQTNATPDAGWSTTGTPGTITGQGGQWSEPNPLGNIAGILAMRSGYGSSGMAQFMRRDGTLPATGAQDMGGQDVNNVKTLNSTTIVNSGNASVGGTLGVTGQTTTNGINNSGALNTTTANVTNALTAGSATINGPATVNGALTAGNTTVNGTATVNGATSVNGTLGVSGGATLASTLTVAGATVTNGLTNNGQMTNTGDIKAPRVYLTTVIAAGTSCAGYSGYQATTSTGQIASCVNGVWVAYTQAPPPSPCNSTSVSWQGCTGTVPYTQSGNTAGVTVTSGSGSATYSCNNGSWAFMSGSCTPPPAGCSAQYVYWSGSASCSGYASAMSSGGGQWVNSSGSGSGSAYASCNNGSISVSSASCSTPTRTFYNPSASNGAALSSNPTARTTYCQAMGYSSAYGSGSQQDYGGNNMAVCWSIDGNLNCTGGGNCSGMAYGNPGCWVQTSVTCQ